MCKYIYIYIYGVCVCVCVYIYMECVYIPIYQVEYIVLNKNYGPFYKEKIKTKNLQKELH